MAEYLFQGELYRTTDQFLAAVASEWLTGGGGNSRAFVYKTLVNFTNEELANEANTAWRLSETYDYYIGNLVTAFGDIRAHYMCDHGEENKLTSVMIDGQYEAFFELRAELAVKAVERDATTLGACEHDAYLSELAASARRSLNGENDFDVSNGPLVAINDAVNYFSEKTRLTSTFEIDDCDLVGVSSVAAIIGDGPWEYSVREGTTKLFGAYVTGTSKDVADAQHLLHGALNALRVARRAARIARVTFPVWTPASGPADDFTLIEGMPRALARKIQERGLRTFAQLAQLETHEVDALDRALNCRGVLSIRMNLREKACALIGPN